MTRDEAINIFKRNPIGGAWEADWVDKFVKLGVLKLDEPKSVEWRAAETLTDNIAGYAELDGFEIVNILTANGFKIVEK